MSGWIVRDFYPAGLEFFLPELSFEDSLWRGEVCLSDLDCVLQDDFAALFPYRG